LFLYNKRERHWIPVQARNDKKIRKPYFEIGSTKILLMPEEADVNMLKILFSS